MLDSNKAIEINPQYEKALRNRGESYWAMGNLNQAIADYNAAISLNPDYANAYISRAIAFYQLKKYSNAWADVHKAEELKAVVNPGFINALTEASGQNG